MKTEKEILFEQIRNNEVVLWLGAGFSIPAGYLSGNDLKAELYKNFQPKDQKDINISEPLDIIASEYEAYYKRTGLINTLQKIFDSITKKESKAHQLLAQFTFFNTIITTNYDSLIEDYIGSRIKVYYDDNDLPIDNNKAALLKIHGDFSHTNGLIITKEDYAKIVDEFPKTLLYNSIIERLTNQNILFIGYSIEDINALSILYKLSSQLGNRRKKCYMLSPTVPQSKIKRLKQQHITYIDGDGEKFMRELEQNILNHVWEDLQKNPANRAAMSYFYSRNIGFESQHVPNGTIISNTFPLSGTLEEKLEVEINLNQYPKLTESLSSLEKIEIPKNAFNKLEYRIEGILSSLITWDSIQKLSIIPIPTLVSKINITFTDNDFEYLDIPIQRYQNKDEVKIELLFGFTTLTLKFSFPKDSLNVDINLSINYKDNKFSKTTNELKFYQLLEQLISQKEFTVLSDDSKINFTYTLPKVPQGLCNHIHYNRVLFQKLRVIEKKHHITFENYTKITDKDREIIEDLYSYTRTFSESDNGEIEMHMVYNHLDKNSMPTIYDGHKFVANFLPKTIQLLNKNISLDNMRVEIHNPTFLKQPQYGKDIEIVIRAKKKDIKIY